MKLSTFIGAIVGALFLSLAGQACAQTLYVNANTLNCRSEAITGSEIVERLTRGTRVTATQTRDGWSMLDRSSDCWVSSRYLTSDLTQAFARPSLSSPRGRSNGGSSGSSRSRPRVYAAGTCPCSGSRICIGPRGGRYCITSGGNKRYGV